MNKKKSEKLPSKKSKQQKIGAMFLFFALLIFMFWFNATIKGGFSLFIGVYGSIMVTYLLGKMVLSFWYKPYEEELSSLKISVVIPTYNESKESILTTVDSIMSQDYPIHEIFVVDDGSSNQSGYKEILKKQREYTNSLSEIASSSDASSTNPYTKLIVHRLLENKGKRHAQAWAFKRATGDVIVTVDSDAYIYPDGVRELIKPFKNHEVKATTGHVNARNKFSNLFTRLIDMRYDNAFRVERSAQSVTGNVLVCSGVFSAYRTDLISKNIEHYENQKFLGEPVQFGDDRCLTNYGIVEGKTIYQSTAQCITDVPSSLKQFIKQQIRWNKSFFRESIIALYIGLKKPKTLIWVILELSLWILFGLAIITSVIFQSITMGYVIAIYYLFYLAISAYARNIFYIFKHPLIYLFAPLYGLIHVCLLFPLRFYALLTIKSNGWGTR